MRNEDIPTTEIQQDLRDTYAEIEQIKTQTKAYLILAEIHEISSERRMYQFRADGNLERIKQREKFCEFLK